MLLSTAEQVASLLSAQFLGRAVYRLSSGPVEVGGRELRARAASGRSGRKEDVRAHELCAFEGLDIQSVGFDDGAVPHPAVHIYLTRGFAKRVQSLPATFDDVPIQVHKMGAISVRPDLAAMNAGNRGNLYERDGRVCCGSSCAPTSELSSGTFGALLRSASELFILSNNHVIAGCNHLPKGQPILAPSSIDGRPGISAPREIARHDAIHELRSGTPDFVTPCKVDAALGKVTHDEAVSSWQGDEVYGYDTPSSVATPISRMRVKKFGRTTGFTEGEVEAHIKEPTPIAYHTNDFKGTVWFTDVWTVRAISSPFALAGDSGSLVVSGDDSAAVGLIFAADKKGHYGWIVPIKSVLAAFLGTALVSKHGS